MRFLLVVKQKKNLEAFLETMRCLVERGHSVTVAVQDRDDRKDEPLAAATEEAGIMLVHCPDVRIDDWAGEATLLRRLRDCVHYLRPALRAAAKLRARMIDRLRQDVQFDADTATLAGGLLAIPGEQVRRLETILMLAERSLPGDPLFDEFITAQKPDVVLLSPLVHFGPTQSDLVASARRLGLPVWMLLHSWDNLSTKGALHRPPDRMFVWNEHQRREADTLHGFPPERVMVVGAPRFDPFFALEPAMTRAEFHDPLGLDPSRPTLLYVCSSRFVSESELPFVNRWVAALRASQAEAVRTCNIVVRPHPDIPLLPSNTPMPRHRWTAAPELSARVARPFDDPRAVVLMTPHATPQGLFESITHCNAVVGLNTTAELEAGIVGRPVFTVLADARDADGQSTTVHFHYLTKGAGGFVSSAGTFDEHVRQIEAALREPVDAGPIRAFVESFLRPLGFDKPVAPLLADALEQAAMAPDFRLKAEATAETWLPASPGAEARSAKAAAGSELDGAGPSRGAPKKPVLRLAGDITPPLFVYATGSAERLAESGMMPIDRATAEWIDRDITLGDVLYDVGAGIGEYAIIAAKRRGAIVVAFEPGYAAHGQLCDNLLLNGCEASVVPIPLALAGRDGLAEIKYVQGQPGEPGYMVRDDIDWKRKHRGQNKPYLQPACLVRLDTLVERQRLPAPHHLRLAPGVSVHAVLAGAPLTLRAPTLKTICLRVGAAHEEATAADLAKLGWTPHTRGTSADDVQLIFGRTNG